MEELLAIFCDVDDFCKDYAEYCKHHLLMDKEKIIETLDDCLVDY